MKKGILLAVSLLVLLYLGISVFFLNHFMFRTALNGVSISLKTVEEVEDVLRAQCDGYSLTVTGRGDLRTELRAGDISMVPMFDGQVEQMLAGQKACSWKRRWRRLLLRPSSRGR